MIVGPYKGKIAERAERSVHNFINRACVEIVEDEEIIDTLDFRDVRTELNSTGHNLTSVLMNPREAAWSIFDPHYDQFEVDQKAPLVPFFNNKSATPTTASKQNNFFASITGTSTPSYSFHSSGGHSSSGRSNSSLTSTLFTMSHSENEQLKHFIARMTKIFTIYMSIHSLSDVSSTDVRNCFDKVPELFFRSDFNFSEEDTFTSVYHIHHSVTTNRLYSFQDLVELALLRQIHISAPAFFRTLVDIKSLQQAVSETTQHLMHNVRHKLAIIDDSITTQPIALPTQQNKQRNLKALSVKLAHMAQIRTDTTAIWLMLEGQDYMGALELVNKCKTLYFEQRLDDIVCMRGIGAQLFELDVIVVKMLGIS